MPGRNIEKAYLPDHYYHIYNRGWNKTEIFLDAEDYAYFEWLLERTLSPEPQKDRKHRPFTWLRDQIDLNTYCLMPNHFHFLVYQRDPRAMPRLISTIATTYTMYFNKKYRRRGPLFENTYRAVVISTDDQLNHLTRYIHLNHREFQRWPHSSYHDYIGAARAWVAAEPLLARFGSRETYREFVLDYEATQRANDAYKREFADSLSRNV